MTDADIEVARRDQPEWRRWGPYLSERAWGTVREDYSADGDAWTSFPPDHARSRAYRWSEGGATSQSRRVGDNAAGTAVSKARPTPRPWSPGARQRRNLLTTLLLSEGIPLLLGGDELGRTQGGNNNTYCQDNEISWVDWAAVDAELIEFVARLCRLRREQPVVRRNPLLRSW